LIRSSEARIELLRISANVTGHFGIVTDDFGTVTGDFGDVTERPLSVS